MRPSVNSNGSKRRKMRRQARSGDYEQRRYNAVLSDTKTITNIKPASPRRYIPYELEPKKRGELVTMEEIKAGSIILITDKRGRLTYRKKIIGKNGGSLLQMTKHADAYEGNMVFLAHRPSITESRIPNNETWDRMVQQHEKKRDEFLKIT